jgi:hypothetical protein
VLLPRKQANLTTDEWRSLAPPLICQASRCSLFSHTTNVSSFYAPWTMSPKPHGKTAKTTGGTRVDLGICTVCRNAPRLTHVYLAGMRPGAGAATDADTAQTSKAGPRNLQIEDAAHVSEGSVEVAQTCMQARGHQRTPSPSSREREKDGVARAKQPLAPP